MGFDSIAAHDSWTGRQRTTEVTVDDHDLEVAYWDGGEFEEETPVVFLHGIPTWSFLWRRLAPEVAKVQYAVAPDLLGFGNSAQHDGFDRSIRAQEAMLDGLLDRLDVDDVVLVGHDIGGSVALRFAAHQPERVEKLVLSNAGCYDSWPVEFVNGLGLPTTPREMDQDDLDETLAAAFGGGLYADEADEEFVDGMLDPWQGEEARVSLTRCAVATNTNHTTEIDYSAITADTLLLWGAEDAMQPVEYAERLAADISGETEVVGLDEAYHWVTEDRPEAYREHVLEFLLE